MIATIEALQLKKATKLGVIEKNTTAFTRNTHITASNSDFQDICTKYN